MKLIRTRETYTSCDNLPLANFIKIVCDGDLSQLYSEPAKFIHKQANLPSIWENIFNEYNELTDNTQSKHIFNIIREINFLSGKLDIIQQSIDALHKFGSKDFPKICEMLNQMLGSDFEFTDESLQTDLNRIVTRSKTLVLQLSQVQKEYKDLIGDENKKATVSDYYNLIAQLEKFNGFKIPLHDTPVSLYISYLNQFKSANENKNG